MLKPGSDSLKILKTEYLDKGTAGLKMFIEKYDLNVERLVKAIQKHPEKYAALFGPEKNLLGLCIREGIGEFFTYLVTGTITQDEALRFTTKNEKSLWDWFKKEMGGSETGDWMWKKPEDKK
jgi:hypothetical protein